MLYTLCIEHSIVCITYVEAMHGEDEVAEAEVFYIQHQFWVLEAYRLCCVFAVLIQWHPQGVLGC